MMKNNGYVNGVFVLVVTFICLWASYENELVSDGYILNISSSAILGSLLTILVGMMCIGIIPFVFASVNKKAYIKNVWLIYFLNGLFWFFISRAISSAIAGEEVSGIGLFGCIFFSLAAYNLIRGNESYKKIRQEMSAAEKSVEKFKCDNCGAIVTSRMKKCPNCGLEFEDEEESVKEEKKEERRYHEEKRMENNKREESDMNQKYSDLTKLKDLLDKKIINEEEFEEEKKKILKK